MISDSVAVAIEQFRNFRFLGNIDVTVNNLQAQWMIESAGEFLPPNLV